MNLWMIVCSYDFDVVVGGGGDGYELGYALLAVSSTQF